MKSEILAVVAEFLDVDPETLQEYKTLEDLNIDSLDFVEIMFEIEEKFDAPVIFEMQNRRNEIRNLGDVLRLTEALILKHREPKPEDAPDADADATPAAVIETAVNE